MNAQDQGQTYEIFAIRHSTNSRRRRGQNFILESNPDALLTLDLFSWVIVGQGRVIVVDTGIDAEKAAKNGHEFLINPADALGKLGFDPLKVETVIVTHLHYDHIGNTEEFPNATFLLQAEEMAYVTGPYMEKPWFRHAYQVDEISRFLGYLHDGRLKLHGRDYTVADGISVHWVGGHSAGQEIVRVRTKRGWVVLASDALHYYEEIELGIPFAVAFNLSDMLTAHDRIRELADSDDHIVPAHDPKIMEIYPAVSPELEGVIVRLDAAPAKKAM